MNVLVIGAGASGVISSLRLKQLNKNIDVTIIEKNARILKKFSSTGNGRCNLFNKNISPKNYTNELLVKDLLDHDYYQKVCDIFSSINLKTFFDSEGRAYPISEDGKSVAELLSNELYVSGVKVILDKEVKEIQESNGKYIVDGIEYDYVIISVGSVAGTKNDVSGFYNVVKNLGTNLVDIRQGLVGFKTYEDNLDLSGLRVKANLTLNNYSSSGEVQFKDDGISGICVMDLSIRNFKQNDKIIIDLLPSFSYDDLFSFVQSKIDFDSNLRFSNLFTGLLNKKLQNHINSKFPNSLVKEMTKEELMKVFDYLKKFSLTIKTTYDYSDSQVVVGGLDIKDYEIKENMYVTGEVINNAGICGGYNLWFAFATGLRVAEMIGGKC